MEILSHLSEGLSSKQIAARLRISHYTVANHRANMLKKTGAKNSTEMLHLIAKILTCTIAIYSYCA